VTLEEALLLQQQQQLLGVVVGRWLTVLVKLPAVYSPVLIEVLVQQGALLEQEHEMDKDRNEAKVFEDVHHL